VSARRRIYLGLGGNLGDRVANLRAALDALIVGGVAIDAVSALYETPPWGVTDQPSFANAAASGLTELGARELLTLAKQIEADAGRDFEAPRWTARPIDIDVLLIEGETVDAPELVVPHPLMQERAFVLVPLRDIASGVAHPLLGQTIEELLTALPQADRDGVVEIEGASWYEFAVGSLGLGLVVHAKVGGVVPVLHGHGVAHPEPECGANGDDGEDRDRDDRVGTLDRTDEEN